MSIGVGIVGCGVIFPFHVEAIAQYQEATIIGIYDIDHEKALWRNEDKEYTVYTSLEALLKDDRIDVVHVLTPHNTHYSISKAALEANKHVLVEKPFTIHFKHAKELVVLAEQKQRFLSVCFQHRMDQTTSFLQDTITSKTYGALVGIKGQVHWLRDQRYYNQASWRGSWEEEGGGSLINQAIHTMDLLIHLAGPVIDVKGSWFNLDHPYIEVDDNVYLLLNFKSGTKGIFTSSNSFPTSTDVQLEFHFEQAQFYLIGETLYQMENGDLVKILENTSREGKKSYFGSGHIDLVTSLYDAIIKGSNNYVRGVQTLETARVIEQVYALNQQTTKK